MCSFSESTAIKLAMSCPEEFVNHNKKFLSRIYPNGMRVDSSNYNPQDLWNCGCQMGESVHFVVRREGDVLHVFYLGCRYLYCVYIYTLVLEFPFILKTHILCS